MAVTTQNTKDKIMDVSTELFNAFLATNVSTIQIAHALGMSVGNLYYHFRNKEHIIREIYAERISVEIDALVMSKEERLSEIGMIRYLTGLANVICKYNFFYSEIYALTCDDPELKTIYRQRVKAFDRELKKPADTWIAVGLLKEGAADVIRDISEVCWMHVIGWLPFRMVATGEVNKEKLASDAVVSMLKVLRPYFTDSANERFERLLDFVEESERAE
ncbi:MAG: TetR/AcrR family transcriptional regulator [Clostridiales Family XIII bacterium]|jgi:AcrR family transcriptional regulator|nr:TetR/AcrR family transcriptional regulator [Clostridiales Family XIII bacterium]